MRFGALRLALYEVVGRVSSSFDSEVWGLGLLQTDGGVQAAAAGAVEALEVEARPHHGGDAVERRGEGIPGGGDPAIPALGHELEPTWALQTHHVALLEAACGFAGSQGASILEGYPVAPTKTPYHETYAWTGFETAFRRAGFTEVARRSDTRPIMRRAL